MFSLFRVVACLAVLAQHSFIWANMSNNFIGTGFITMLHLSRTGFFFLTGLVVCYAQITHPRTRRDFWRHRFWEVGIPYLAWTGIYLIFSLITVSASWDEAGRFLRHNLFLGFSQMYFIVVIFQFYVVFPFLLGVLRRFRPGPVVAASLAFAIFVGFCLHDPSWFGALTNHDARINETYPWGRDILVYQEYFIGGMLVALHLDKVIAFVTRYQRRLLMAAAALAGLSVLYYCVQVWRGSSVGTASDIYEPSAMAWCLVAIMANFTISRWWWQRSSQIPGDPSKRRFPSPVYLASLTGGVFFAHTLFINMIRSLLDETGLRTSLPWSVTVLILFVGTVSITFTVSALIQKTPLRWVLGGPIRSQQRAAYNGTPPEDDPIAKPAPAISADLI
jgi:peptidoglycan/LPS O-acetylase OafA/YrhL